LKHLLDIRPESGTYIYSSSEAYSEEQDFDFLRLNSWLRLFSFEIRGFRIDQNGLHFERGHHASGHASSEDLRRAIETADPEIIIPVHTEKAEWFLEQFGERVKKVSDGGSVEI
jgi:ribonuclease J